MSTYYDMDTKPIGQMEWAKLFETLGRDRQIDQTEVGEVHVSTVYLGLNHQWGDGPPLVFETMIFGGPNDQWQDRYTTLEQARTGHARVVESLRTLGKVD